MADIDVQRKPPGAFIWIAALIILGLLIWAFIALFGDEAPLEDRMAGVPAPAAPGTAQPLGAAGDTGVSAVPGPVQEYLTTCAQVAPEAMSLDHRYTSDCIRRLVDGTAAVSASDALAGVDVSAQLGDARARAEALESNASSTEHAAMTQDAFMAVGGTLSAMQEARFPALGSQAAQVEETARQLDRGAELLQQREVVQRFFRQAGEILIGMSVAPTSGA